MESSTAATLWYPQPQFPVHQLEKWGLSCSVIDDHGCLYYRTVIRVRFIPSKDTEQHQYFWETSVCVESFNDLLSPTACNVIGEAQTSSILASWTKWVLGRLSRRLLDVWTDHYRLRMGWAWSLTVLWMRKGIADGHCHWFPREKSQIYEMFTDLLATNTTCGWWTSIHCFTSCGPPLWFQQLCYPKGTWAIGYSDKHTL